MRSIQSRWARYLSNCARSPRNSGPWELSIWAVSSCGTAPSAAQFTETPDFYLSLHYRCSTLRLIAYDSHPRHTQPHLATACDTRRRAALRVQSPRALASNRACSTSVGAIQGGDTGSPKSAGGGPKDIGTPSGICTELCIQAFAPVFMLQPGIHQNISKVLAGDLCRQQKPVYFTLAVNKCGRCDPFRTINSPVVIVHYLEKDSLDSFSISTGVILGDSPFDARGQLHC